MEFRRQACTLESTFKLETTGSLGSSGLKLGFEVWRFEFRVLRVDGKG